MLYLFGFDEVAFVAGDVFFVDPNPLAGQEGAEAGVRIELRRLVRQPLRASIYSAQPASLAEPLWRGDFFESFPDGRNRRDRVHYHPFFNGWDPAKRHFDEELSADPLAWLEKRLANLGEMLGVEAHPDAAALSARSGEIVETVDRLWQRVRSGELDPPAGWTSEPAYRLGWL